MNDDLPLFAYGTLMFPPVIGAVVGREPAGRAATAHGYLRLEVAGQTFPGLIEDRFAPDSTVNGVLYGDLSAEEWRRLNEFEDDFYVLTEISVICEDKTVRALVYLVPETARAVLNDVPWNEDFFRERYLHRFVSGRQN